VKHGRVFSRLDEARHFKRTVEHSLDVGTYSDPARGRITLAELWETYAEAPPKPLRPTTRALYEAQWRNHIALGSYRRTDSPIASAHG
jgi:hypothetical protein